MARVQRLIEAFTDEQAARLAHISIGQIRYWDQTNFFEPSIAFENRRVAFSRIYSFDDVVALRVLGELRNEHDVPLQHLRRVRDRFKLKQSVWKDEEIFVHKKRVYFKNERGNFVHSETDEETLPNIPLPRVIAQVHDEAIQLGIRPSEVIGKKAKAKSVARSAEVFEGTRIPIDMVKEYFDEGLDIDDILSDYPTLTEKDIKAAIRWLGIRAA
ncbi:MAG: DUF433 domain-containing protein [Paracoccaceae bacterium]|nr:DUF433 domain-containing protein [Paracoccaceae bacterium]